MTVWEKALEIASRLTLPIPVVAFALVFVAFMFTLAIRSKKRGIVRILFAALIVIVALGLAPLAASTYLQSHGIYHVRVWVLGIDKQPVSEAEVISLSRG